MASPAKTLPPDTSEVEHHHSPGMRASTQATTATQYLTRKRIQSKLVSFDILQHYNTRSLQLRCPRYMERHELSGRRRNSQSFAYKRGKCFDILFDGHFMLPFQCFGALHRDKRCSSLRNVSTYPDHCMATPARSRVILRNIGPGRNMITDPCLCVSTTVSAMPLTLLVCT